MSKKNSTSSSRNRGKNAHSGKQTANPGSRLPKTARQSTAGASQNVPSANQPKGIFTVFYSKVYPWAKRWIGLLIKLIGVAGPSAILVLLGFSTPASSIPLLVIIQQHQMISVAVGGGLAFTTLMALIISHGPDPSKGSGGSGPSVSWSVRWWMTATIISTISFILCITLLAVILIRPVWCPPTFCAPPQLVPITRSTHDNNLDVYFTTIQSSSYVIPADPASYSLQKLPKDIGALNVDNTSSAPYRVVLGIHSLQQGRFGIIIEQVALVVEQVPPMASPLRVWNETPLLDYYSNPYRVVYRGQEAGATLPATYVPLPSAHVQLAPGEADELDIQVVSSVAVDLKFRVQIIYRVTNESQWHIITLSNVFEVVFFKNTSNWHQYQLKDGHFVAS